MRTKNSCRVSVYYKIEKYNPITLCWKVVQKRYKSEHEARKSKKTGDRIMKFNGEKFEAIEL